MLINTGTPRSVQGHGISGALFGLILSSAYELANCQKGVCDKKATLKRVGKATLEGGIIAASGIAAANALGDESKSPFISALQALTFVGVGIAGVYAVDKLSQSVKNEALSASEITQKPTQTRLARHHRRRKMT